ncbi:NAD+ synthase (glutamine-hydrolyzing) [Kitasatospora sp. GAS204A]|uniref:NAD+ synthase n=1 Tax=unclassified Kitasatospora TaxID=2633591 RepID=UPI002473ECF0|nr:NAD+ synthase [Kitasatospora sp. GAS204B]MDH6115791.1 NAD+ synthase (glutamine-hydrolyzing) [Kitasatospora sp. GAS204B]
MPNLRLAMAQFDPHVGDIAHNSEEVVRWTRLAAERGARVVAFPEMALTGYPVEDLALRASFVDASRAALVELAQRLAAEGLGDLAVVVGYLGRSRESGRPQNCAAVLHGGQVVTRFAKHFLPNYGVFDEYRWFEPGDQLQVLRVDGMDVALAICEDIWQEGGRARAAGEAGAGLLLVVNGSPYERNKDDQRLDLVRRRAAEAGCPLAYLNMVGGQDELVFDGDSLVVDAAGQVLARAPQFEESLLVVDLELPAASSEHPDGQVYSDGLHLVRTAIGTEPAEQREPVAAELAPRLTDEAEVYAALVTGTRAYVRKNGFKSVLIGLSGGIDSALVAAIAVDAIGAENVHCVSMPSQYSSQHSRDDAAELARRTGLHFRTVPIAPMFDAYMAALGLTGLAEENLQSRLRGTLLMAISNQEGHIVLAPGNKSELAVGYSTLYGDSVGAYGPIKDVYKTLIFQLSRWRNEVAVERGELPPIPENTIVKPPSAELRPDQVDTDSLPDYDLLDTILDAYIEGDQGRDAIVARGFEAAVVDRVVRLVDTAEYKRRQYPPGPKISPKGFGRDRRLPITNGWRRG